MFETLRYDADGPIATITLNRPGELNTIVPPMTDELEAAVNRAVLDRAVKVIVLRGAGRSFCAGSTSARASTNGTTSSPPRAAGTRARSSS